MTVRYAWEYDDADNPRPAEVARLEAFCNTIDRHTYGEHAAKPNDRRDLLSTPAGLGDWLAGVGLLGGDTPDGTADTCGRGAPVAVTQEDLNDAHVLRDGLRAWLALRQGLESDTSVLERAEELIARLRLQVRLHAGTDAAAAVNLQPAHPAVAGAFERLVADLATAQATGTLRRLKVCSAPDCAFVYYDHSRSRTSRWCSMEACGNRVKTRRYRQRQRR